MATMMERFEAALAARGEQNVGNMVRGSKWTRHFKAERVGGGLVPAQPSGSFWFVGTAGSLRVGPNRSLSRAVGGQAKQALLEEGAQALAALEQSKHG